MKALSRLGNTDFPDFQCTRKTAANGLSGYFLKQPYDGNQQSKHYPTATIELSQEVCLPVLERSMRERETEREREIDGESVRFALVLWMKCM